MQTPISQGLTTNHPQLKCLSCGAVDTGPMSHPLPILWPTGHRMIYPAYVKRLCVCVCEAQMQSIFVSQVVRRVDRPFGPLNEMAGRVVNEANTPIFIVVYGPRPSLPTPLFWWRGGGQGANSIWRHPECQPVDSQAANSIWRQPDPQRAVFLSSLVFRGSSLRYRTWSQFGCLLRELL